MTRHSSLHNTIFPVLDKSISSYDSPHKHLDAQNQSKLCTMISLINMLSSFRGLRAHKMYPWLCFLLCKGNNWMMYVPFLRESHEELLNHWKKNNVYLGNPLGTLDIFLVKILTWNVNSCPPVSHNWFIFARCLFLIFTKTYFWCMYLTFQIMLSNVWKLLQVKKWPKAQVLSVQMCT